MVNRDIDTDADAAHEMFQSFEGMEGLETPAPAARKQLRHPEDGVVVYDYATFQSNDDPALKLALYTRVA